LDFIDDVRVSDASSVIDWRAATACAQQKRNCHGRAKRQPLPAFGRYILSATTPFTREDLVELRTNTPAVVRRVSPTTRQSMPSAAGGCSQASSVYTFNNRARDARDELKWSPLYDFRHTLDCLRAGDEPRSPLAISIGTRGYHAISTDSH
jgi:UDP-glucose 4-epimerase